MPEVSVVLPTRNEREGIGECIRTIQQVFEREGIDGEIIVADSSTDDTPSIARSLGARVVKPDRLGYGYAYRVGFASARGRYIVMGDADGTYDFSELPRLLEPLKNGADMVIGSRFRGTMEKGAMPWLHRHIGNPILTWFLNVFFKAGVSDAHSGFRAFSLEALQRMRLRSSGMEFASEMVMEAVRRGLRIEEVPITYRRRMGDSKLNSFSDGWRHLKFMLLHTPKHLYYLPGLVMFTLGMVVVLLMSVFDVWVGGVHLGIHSMFAASLLAILGYQLVSLGLFSAVYGHGRGVLDYDRITHFIIEHAPLERGAAVGAAIFLLGFVYTAYLVVQWVGSGFTYLPVLKHDVLAFTLLVIGAQTFFFSFFLSMLGEGK